ncbi:MAG: outer membrane beta-barrel family protein [Prevotella sp.]|nr:outer membrane beta-barrel family protein [Prevotella sp.]
MIERIIILLFAFTTFSTLSSAQDTDEFQRIARRIMDAYDAGDEVAHAPDSAHFYGGAYLGAGSNGRAMPSGYVTYLKNNLLITSQLAVDFSELNTDKDVRTNFTNGDNQLTSTNILTKYEKQDFSTRLDYAPSKGHILTFGIIESLDNKRVNESTIKNGYKTDGTSQEPNYEEQHRSNTDLKLGALMQYIRDFDHVGRLTTRLNLKYNYKPTDVESDTWAAHSEASLREQRQTLYNFDPYAMIRFQSDAFSGFKFGLEEKYTIEDMRINDTATKFNFHTFSSLTSLSVNYSHDWLTLNATFRYEHFINDIDDHLSTESHDRTYNDWMLSAKATAKIGNKNKLVMSFDRDISRPNYTQLYPFVHIGSSIGVMVVGNPSLEPSKSSQVKLSYTRSNRHFTHTHSLAYKRISDDISQISAFDEASQRSVKTWVNDARYGYLRYAAEGEMNYGAFSMTMGFHAQYLDYDGEKVSSDNAWSYSFKARPQVKLPKEWTLATVLLYTGRETHRYYYHQSNLYWSLRAVKQIGSWGIYAFVQDILQPDRKQILTNKDYDMTTVTKPNSRCLIVGCSYTF